ncbi:MAG: hypothetical protein LBH13_06360 [Cellulomonadaceae bacterium]|jgi:hypothetical protein|nr:hypothetical protein [Cellulomonadaceae bacterium]
MATIDKHGALHDRSGKYAGSTRGGVSTEVKPRTAIEWKQALFSDFSPPDTSSVKNPEANAAAKQALFLAPVPVKSNEGNTVKLKNVLKGIGVGAAIIGVAAGCANGNATEGAPGNETPTAPATTTVEVTPDAEATQAPTEATPESETPAGPTPGEVGYVISADEVNNGGVSIENRTNSGDGWSVNYEVFTTHDGNSLYRAKDGSAVVIDVDQPLPQAVLDDLSKLSFDNSESASDSWYSLRNAGVEAVFIVQYSTQVNGEYKKSVGLDGMSEGPAFTCARDGMYNKRNNPIILDHDEAITLAQKCAAKQPGLRVYDVTGLVPPTQLQ